MRKTRLLVACFIAACSALPVASPAAADEVECSPSYVGDFLNALLPPLDQGYYVEINPETITIRGDNVVALVERYRAATETLVACLAQDAEGIVTPYVDCVMERSEAIRTSPDPVGRYVEVGEDLVVRIHYGLVLEEARLIFNCNGIVTSG
ncbi:MAG: hypothetical protein M3279_02455 [Actinomycetota bacterium]|nr:hypothetical protein [Actinomycetota bacterium]